MNALAMRLADVYITPGEYLAAEAKREVRHEYFAGMVRSMPGSKVSHNRIVSNLAFLLRRQLRGGPCEVFFNDIKVYVRTLSEQFYYYPDVIVDCSNSDDSSLLAPEPKVIFEVLSESTESVDRGEKRMNYCTLDSLQAYVLVWQTDPALMVYRRHGTEWSLEFFGGLDAMVALPEIGCTLPVRDVYERVRFET